MRSTGFCKALIASLLFTGLAAQAGVVTVRSGQGVGNTASGACAATDLGSVAADCLGYVSGNDSNDALTTLAGAPVWHGLSLGSLSMYRDGTAAAGSTTALFDVVQSADDASRGQLTFLQTLTGPYVLTLKGGNTWAAYYIANGATAGSTIAFDIPGEQGRGLSHASIYAAGAVTPGAPQVLPSAVPEPATAALVLLSLAGVAGTAWRVRRRGAASKP